MILDILAWAGIGMIVLATVYNYIGITSKNASEENTFVTTIAFLWILWSLYHLLLV